MKTRLTLSLINLLRKADSPLVRDELTQEVQPTWNVVPTARTAPLEQLLLQKSLWHNRFYRLRVVGDPLGLATETTVVLGIGLSSLVLVRSTKKIPPSSTLYYFSIRTRREQSMCSIPFSPSTHRSGCTYILTL